MPEEIIIDGLEEHAFRRSIETLLRHGRADEAVERLKTLLPEVAGEGKILPARLARLEPSDIRLSGWEQIAARIEDYSRPGAPITAIGIGVGDPADTGLMPDADGNLRPPLQTSYYSDATFPFSETDRADLLEGYSAFGCEWQGDHDRLDETLSIEGIDDLYGAIARLENEVAASERPDSEHIRAGAIGACYLGVMVWQAARKAAIESGLPRPLAILLVNSDAYPFFDAPVMTCEEYLDNGALQVIDRASPAPTEDWDAEDAESASLIGLAGMHRAPTKKMALVLDGEEAYNPLGMADDLVAQAAFDPSSVDISRFMPDVSEFRNEPDEDEFPYAETAYAEPAFPEEPAFTPAPPQEPAGWAEPSAPLPETDVEPAHDRNPYLDPFPPAAEPAVTVPAAPDLPAIEDREPIAAPVDTMPHIAEVGMPWHDYNTDLPFAVDHPVGYVAAPPASHSIRDRIRVAPVAEPSRPSGGILARVAGFFKRVKEILLRR